jgi:NAD(P)-dependent dehydrogenase (short-subunit alcohol dehydrogenase family)
MTTSLVIGGASDGVGGVIARRFAERGDEVIITSRDAVRAQAAAKEVGGNVRGLAVDLSQPKTLAAALEAVPDLDNVVITAMESVPVTLAAFDIDDAIRSVTIKLVGYAEVVRVLRGRLRPGGSVVLFGGLAKERPYPGSTMVTTFNAGLTGLVKTLAAEIAPHRVNALHPALIGDSPKWRDVTDHPHIAATPIGRLITMEEVADATDFLLRNAGMNAHDLYIDGGILIR